MPEVAPNPAPVELLQHLIRFDTTNPPGNEAGCIAYINNLLTEVGVETQVLALDENRPNLVARLKGQGNAPPLLLQGHVDVVTTAGQSWQQPPFEAKIVDGYVWGRGALDMKGGVAMMLAAILRAKTEHASLPGDVILAVVSDEEAGGDFGARYLVESHAHLFESARYAIGELGGFSLPIAGRRFYPIQVAEKQICWMKATLRGPAGHGSLPLRGGAMAKMARLVRQLDEKRLPVHITPAARLMFESIAAVLPLPASLLFRLLLNPAFSDQIVNLLGKRGRIFEPLLHNTVSANIVRGGDKINVIPAEVVLELDGRLLPGFTPDDMFAEFRHLVGEEAEIELVRHDPGPAEPDMGLFETLVEILRQADPSGTPVPLLMSGVTDGRYFSRLGIQTYGFLPTPLPADFNFTETIHAADERIPVEALEFGAQAIYTLLQRNPVGGG